VGELTFQTIVLNSCFVDSDTERMELMPENEATSPATRERLLDAAEHLFADLGFTGASLRLITDRARANVAAVNYHFGSKEVLYQEVFIRRVRPMNEQRRQRLTAALAGQHQPVPLATLLDILLRPIVELAATGGDRPHPFPRVMSRNLIEPQPFMRDVVAGEIGPLLTQFEPPLRQVLPELDRAALGFRLRYVLGATNMTFAAVPFLPGMQPWFGPNPAPPSLLQHLLLLSEAILRAPLAPTTADPLLPPSP
jgi:AcrR family transcriptional regulator